MKKKLLPIALMCLLGISLTACGGGGGSDKPDPEPGPGPVEPEKVAVTGVTLDKEEAELVKDHTLTLVATVAPADATNKNVTWTSDDQTVATVANGVVTAVNVGVANITVKTEDGKFTDSCKITVIKEITSITISNKEQYAGFVVDDVETLALTIDPEDNIPALLDAGALKITSSDEEVASVAGLIITGVSAGTATITVELFGKTDTLELTVGEAIPGIPYSVKGALDKGIEQAPFNGKAGANSAITTTCFELKGEIIAVSPYSSTGYNAILDDGTESVYLQIAKASDDPIPFEVGDFAKVTCKLTNYYGLLEGVSRKAATGDNAAYIPAKDAEVIENPFDSEWAGPTLAEPTAMSGEQYAAYFADCVVNAKKDATTYSTLRYATLDVEYSEAFKAADKGNYKITDSYGLNIYDGFELDEPFEGQKSTVDVFLLGANTGKNKSNAIATKQVPLAPTGVEFSQDAVTVVHGRTLKLEYACTPAGAYSRNVAWSSSDEAVATVENGVVTGVYVGEGTREATITVDLGNEIKDTIVVEVFGEDIPVTAVELAETAKTFVGLKLELTATPTPAINTEEAVWSSDNEEVATVDQKGVVTAVAAGTANITVRYNDSVSATCAVTVGSEDDLWSFDGGDLVELDAINTDNKTYQYVIGQISDDTYSNAYKYGNLYISNRDGSKKLLSYGMYDLDGHRYDSMPVKPQMGDVVVLYSVATTYKDTPQLSNAIVVAINGQVFGDPLVTRALTMSAATAELDVGNTLNLSVTATPRSGSLTGLEWSSSDEAVATVENGVVTGVADGEATITATLGELTATCVVTVSTPAVEYTKLEQDVFASSFTGDATTATHTNGIVTYTLEKNTSSTDNRLSDTDHLRVYKNAKLTIAISSGTLGKVELTCTASSYAAEANFSALPTGATVSISGTVVTITLPEGLSSFSFVAANQVRINKAALYYVPAE